MNTKTSGFILSIVSALIGSSTLITTSILNQLMVKLGRVAYQNASSGSYNPSDYVMDFTFANTFAIVLIVVGVGFAVYTMLNKQVSK